MADRNAHRFPHRRDRYVRSGEHHLIGVAIDVVNGCSVEDRGRKLASELLTGPTQNSFVDLTDVHSRRHTQWIQYDIHRSSILEEWHVLISNDLGHNALVPVASGHLVSHLQLPLLCDIYLGQLDDARRQFIAHGDGELLSAVDPSEIAHLDLVVVQQIFDQCILRLVCGPGSPDTGEVLNGVEASSG